MPWKKLSPTQVARFERLAWPHLASMLRVARSLTRQPAEAEDLVQESMMKAMRAIDRFQEDGDIRPWLLTILRRTWIDLYRSNRRLRGQVSLEGLAEPSAAESDSSHAEVGQCDAEWSNPEALMHRMTDEQVLQALEELPEEMRWTLLLVDVEQLDQAQAALILQVPLGTIKSRASRGRAMLRDRLFGLARQRGWVSDSPKEATHE